MIIDRALINVAKGKGSRENVLCGYNNERDRSLRRIVFIKSDRYISTQIDELSPVV